jgi:hypothetical protein
MSVNGRPFGAHSKGNTAGWDHRCRQTFHIAKQIASEIALVGGEAKAVGLNALPPGYCRA